MLTLKDLRKRAMLTQSELAEKVGVRYQTIYYWESGRGIPRPTHQRLLVEALKCTPDELLTALAAIGKGEQEEERPAA